MVNKKIVSVYPSDKERLMGLSRVAEEVSYGAPTEKGILKQLVKLGFEDVSLSPTQTITVDEIAKMISSSIMSEVKNKPWERFSNERNLAHFATLRSMRAIYGKDKKNLVVKGWIPGSKIYMDGDSFELTGKPCPQCHVNPESYGHGGGVRCVDVENCGYWKCL